MIVFTKRATVQRVAFVVKAHFVNSHFLQRVFLNNYYLFPQIEIFCLAKLLPLYHRVWKLRDPAEI